MYREPCTGLSGKRYTVNGTRSRSENMPTYEYECAKCKKRHEAFQSITAKPLTKCPRCGGRLKRGLGSGSGFLFKGTGFYITDYRSKSYRDAKKKDESGGSSSPSTRSPTPDRGGAASDRPERGKAASRDDKASSGDSKSS